MIFGSKMTKNFSKLQLTSGNYSKLTAALKTLKFQRKTSQSLKLRGFLIGSAQGSRTRPITLGYQRFSDVL